MDGIFLLLSAFIIHQYRSTASFKPFLIEQSYYRLCKCGSSHLSCNVSPPTLLVYIELRDTATFKELSHETTGDRSLTNRFTVEKLSQLLEGKTIVAVILARNGGKG